MHDAREALADRGITRARGSFVVELADPLPELSATGAASGGPDGTTYKVAGYEMPAGRTRLSTMRPSHLVELLGHPELARPAQALEVILERALRSAADSEPDPGASR